MARPKTPLISRRKALEAALRIVDTEGLDALSVRRLAAEIGVHGASLYHHFANKEEIVVGAAELALEDVRPPRTDDEDWRTWLPRNSQRLREAILEHPELVPVIVRRGELGLGAQWLDDSVRRLLDEGVPLAAVIPLINALEMFAVGSAIHQTRHADGYSAILGDTSDLAVADRASGLSADEIFSVVTAAIIGAVARASTASAAPVLVAADRVPTTTG